jgi:hypothetical protein
MKTIKTLSLGAIGLSAGLVAFSATAAEVTYCPTKDSMPRDHWVTMPDGSGTSCYLFGNGANDTNGNPADDKVLQSDPKLVLLDKTDDAVSGAAQGALVVSGGGASETFYVIGSLLSNYTNFIISFKVGSTDPTWSSFKVPNILACTMANPCSWETDPVAGGGLSHSNLYGSVVPIPAAAWLLGSGLLGLFAVGRRRKTGEVAAA